MRVTAIILTLALAVPSAAYHIDASGIAGSSATSADWIPPSGGAFIWCESNGINDTRNPSPFGLPGIGGLCTTGQNDATGSPKLPSIPPVGTWIRLDVCSATTSQRNHLPTGTGGPFLEPQRCSGGVDETGSFGRTDQHHYIAELGVYSCEVPTDASGATRDYALYYEALYAWWSYDGEAPYSVGDAPGDPQTPGNNEDAWHGHVAIFIDPLLSKPSASSQGSVEVIATPPPSGLSDQSSPWGATNNCGGSPSNPAFGGPVVRAPYIRCIDPTYTGTEYVLLFDPSTMPSIGATYNGAPVASANPTLGRVTVDVTTSGGPNDFFNQTSQDPAVQTCDPNWEGETAQAPFAPNDPGWPQQYGPDRIRAPDAWAVAQGGGPNARRVCIVDTGVDRAHSDFQTYNGVPGVTFPIGHNILNPGVASLDDNGHGTHMTGIVAARIHNQVGIAGIAQSEIIPVKVAAANGRVRSDHAADGIEWCGSHGAHIINLSLGFRRSPPDLLRAIRGLPANTLVVAVSGNDGCSGPDCLDFPARYEPPQAIVPVIAVGCTTPDAPAQTTNVRCSFSNAGVQLDLVAPGFEILSTCTNGDPLCASPGCTVVTLNDNGPGLNNDYAKCSGTSQSAAHVSGAAALIWSQAPHLPAHTIRECLERTAVDLGGVGHDKHYGHGLVNVEAALAAAMALQPGVAGPC